MIDEELRDALGELVNISFGAATALIADLFDSFATLRVPDIKILPMREIETIVLDGNDQQEIYITGQQFKGNFSGEIVFAIDTQSARNMQHLIYEAEGFEDRQAYDETAVGHSVLEISNIIGSSCIGKLVELLNEDVIFSPPTIELTRQLLAGLHRDRFSQVIVIQTLLEFKHQKILGRLFILFNNEMFSALEKALMAFIEDL